MKRVNTNKPINSSMTFSIEELLEFLRIIPQLENCEITATEFTNNELIVYINEQFIVIYDDEIPVSNKVSTIKGEYKFEKNH